MKTVQLCLVLCGLALVQCVSLKDGRAFLKKGKAFLENALFDKMARINNDFTWPPKFCNGLQCPKYTVMDSVKDEFEVREYQQSHWVSTNSAGVDYSEASEENFMRLFKYISGANEGGKKIAMTAPVITRIIPGQGPACENNFTMSFFVADPDAPKPTNSKVFLQTFPPLRAYVRYFPGYEMGSFKPWLEQAIKLDSYLKNTTYEYNHNFYFTGGYDSPFKFFNRHNEIWFIAQ